MLLTGELYTDLMEIHMLELRKLPSEAQNEKGIIHWMRFLGGKKREEFEDMAKQDEYIGEAYEELKKLSLDDQKRLEYELRQKAIRDYNSQMNSALKQGCGNSSERSWRRACRRKTLRSSWN